MALRPTAAKLGAAGLSGPRVLAEWALVGLATSLIAIWLALSPVADRANHLIYDLLLPMAGRQASDAIVLVAIDDRSIETIGRWPWPRTIHANLIDRLAQAAPRAIAYDILFTETAAGDEQLAAALTSAGNVYLPLLVDGAAANAAPARVVEPAPPLNAAAAGLGHAALTPDADGLLRRLPLYLTASGEIWPHLMAAMAEGAAETPAPDSIVASGGRLEAAYPAFIKYVGPPGSFRTISFVDLLRGEVSADFLSGKYILVGVTAEGLGDRYATPASNGQLRPGLDVMANLLHGLLSQDTLKPAPRLLTTVFALVPLWILMGGFLWLRPSANMLLGLALAVAAIAVSAVAFIGFDLWIAPAAAIVSLALAYPIWSWRRLAAASAFLQSELDRFAREGQGPAATPYAAGDVVSRQTETLRRAMRQLRDFERFTADVLRSLPDAMLVLDENGRVLRFNDKAAALFGGLKLGDDIEARFQSLGELTWRRFVSDDAKSNEIVTPAGQVLKVDCVRITDGDDKFAGYIMGLADVTAIRSTERQRERALQLLTHDMRAPQTSILTMLQDPRALDDSDAVRRIAAAARRTLDLADAYVQLARAESQPIQPELVDLSQMLLDAADMLWPQASSKDLAITTPTGEEEFLVHGDRTLITRALINLLDNAIKHSPRHSVIVCTLESRLEHQPVCICTIQDQGPGLSPEARERLFQPFGHGGSNVEGSGLGLAFVRTVMERHNGRVQYKPGGAGGATLVLTFPQAIRPIG